MRLPAIGLLVLAGLSKPDQFADHLVDALRLEAAEGKPDHGADPDARGALKPDLAQHLVQPCGLVRVAEAEPVAMLWSDLGSGVLDARGHERTIARLGAATVSRAHEITYLDWCYSRVVSRYTEGSR